jgi:hypothetical protein
MTAAVNELVDFECRAIHLRNRRFELADKIRFTQDTLLHTTGDTIQLSKRLLVFNDQKKILLANSLALADSISKETREIQQQYLIDKEKEKAFFRLMEAELKKRDCK